MFDTPSALLIYGLLSLVLYVAVWYFDDHARKHPFLLGLSFALLLTMSLAWFVTFLNLCDASSVISVSNVPSVLVGLRSFVM